MKFPVKGKSKKLYTKEEYEALSIEEKRVEGFYTDPAVVYETVEEQLCCLGKNYIGEKYIPISTISNGCSDYNRVYFEQQCITHGTKKESFALIVTTSGTLQAGKAGSVTITTNAPANATVSYELINQPEGVTISNNVITTTSDVTEGTIGVKITVKVPPVPKLDEDGSPVEDEEGNPVYETEEKTYVKEISIKVAAVTHTISLTLDKASLPATGGEVNCTVKYDGENCNDATITCTGATVEGYKVTLPANETTNIKSFTIKAEKSGKSATASVKVAGKEVVTTKYNIGTLINGTFAGFEDDPAAELSEFIEGNGGTITETGVTLPYIKTMAVKPGDIRPFAITTDTTKDVGVAFYDNVTHSYVDYKVETKTFTTLDGTFKVFAAIVEANGTLEIKIYEK